MALILRTDGTTERVSGANADGTFTLAQLQQIVGGYIEFVRLPGERILVVNEEGKLRHLPVNAAASAEAHDARAIFAWDVIVGDVAILDERETD